MGLSMRRRRPVLRLTGAAALGTVVYQSGVLTDEELAAAKASSVDSTVIAELDGNKTASFDHDWDEVELRERLALLPIE